MTSGPRIRVQETVLHAVRFQDERSRVPEAWQGSPLDLVGRQHLVRAHKRGTPAFSPAVYRAGAARGKRGIAHATALALDFDHLTTEAAEEVWRRLADRGWAWVGYSSFSHLADGDADADRNADAHLYADAGDVADAARRRPYPLHRRPRRKPALARRTLRRSHSRFVRV